MPTRPYACLGCDQDFATSKSLSHHRRGCKSSHKRVAGLLDKIEAAPRKRLKTTRVDALEDNGEAQVGFDMVVDDPNPDSAHEKDTRHVAIELPPTRSGRPRKFPKQYEDFQPSQGQPVPHVPESLRPPSTPRPTPGPSKQEVRTKIDPTIQREVIRTAPDSLGLYQEYVRYVHLSKSGATSTLSSSHQESARTEPSKPQPKHVGSPSSIPIDRSGLFHLSPYAPFTNITTARIMQWYYNGSSTKSAAELQRLISEVMLSDDFNSAHLRNFSIERELRLLDKVSEAKALNPSSLLSAADGWKESSVKIKLPAEGHCFGSEDEAPEYEVSGVWHRNLLDIVRNGFQDPSARDFKYTPYQQFWLPTPNSPPERVISELYNSDEFLKEYEHIQKQKPSSFTSKVDSGLNVEDFDPLKIENTIAALMFWSDSTHVAQFGNASLWPIYAFFGNQSKYERSKPTQFAAHHLAYIPSVPDALQDAYTKIFGIAATQNTMTHLKRDLMQAIWLLLLDDEFMDAYMHGIIMKCADGVIRRVFPRIFTYSADYPEKALLATIKQLGQRPCPRCFIHTKYISALGTTADDQRRQRERVDSLPRQFDVNSARRHIFENGKGTKGKTVEGILNDKSEIPTRNAFSSRFFEFGFNFFLLFVVDLLHEFELGVWKDVFKHLLRILFAAGESLIQVLNERYRAVPTFGNGVIRRFGRNASSLRQIAARDLEDLLICSIPCFEGLLSRKHNEIVLDLLFILCTWHSHAKLRLHTETTLATLQTSTRSLGQVLRRFVKDVCSQYQTNELPSEVAARGRRAAKASSKGRKSGSQASGVANTKAFNMFTYKMHALGHYADTIRRFGTTDNYSTQIGELEHRRVKRFYQRTNKRRNFTKQITQHQRRERIVRLVRARLAAYDKARQATNDDATAATQVLPAATTRPKSKSRHRARSTPKRLPATIPLALDNDKSSLQAHHHIGSSNRDGFDIRKFLAENRGDPATKTFYEDLVDHVLLRLHGIHPSSNTTFTKHDYAAIFIVDHHVWTHKTLRINYTTYDARRAQDSINIRSHPDIMLLSPPNDISPRHNTGTATCDEHSAQWDTLCFARVLGIFHVYVTRSLPGISQPRSQRIDLLWVRWFENDPTHHAGWTARRLPRVKFVPESDPGAFGFVDPSDVIRGVHLIPAFAHGMTDEYLGPSIARRHEAAQGDEDWRYYYAGIFVDRDMMMRFRGGGIGHGPQYHQVVAPPSQTFFELPRKHDDLDELTQEFLETDARDGREDEEIDDNSDSDGDQMGEDGVLELDLEGDEEVEAEGTYTPEGPEDLGYSY